MGGGSPLRKDQQLELITVPRPGKDPHSENASATVPPHGSVFDQILGETPTAPVHEPLLKKRQLAKHYGVCDRTIERWVTADMPRHYVGKRQMRFRLSEVQVWLQQNHIDRFAAHGIAMTAAEVKRRIINIPILNGLEILQMATPLNEPAQGSETLALKRQHNASIVTPRCKPGRKRKSPPVVPCQNNGHKWRTSRYTRTCVVCGCIEERDSCNRWR
jgi:hypothetical protein